MLFPGNNKIVLCTNALMKIVEEKLQASIASDEGEPFKVMVTNISYRDNTFEISVTTDDPSRP